MPASRSPQAASFASLSTVSGLSHSNRFPSRLSYGSPTRERSRVGGNRKAAKALPPVVDPSQGQRQALAAFTVAYHSNGSIVEPLPWGCQ